MSFFSSRKPLVSSPQVSASPYPPRFVTTGSALPMPSHPFLSCGHASRNHVLYLAIRPDKCWRNEAKQIGEHIHGRQVDDGWRSLLLRVTSFRPPRIPIPWIVRRCLADMQCTRSKLQRGIGVRGGRNGMTLGNKDRQKLLLKLSAIDCHKDLGLSEATNTC